MTEESKNERTFVFKKRKKVNEKEQVKTKRRKVASLIILISSLIPIIAFVTGYSDIPRFINDVYISVFNTKEEAPKEDPMVEFILRPKAQGVSIQTFSKAYSMIEERVSATTTNYEMKIQNEAIHVKMPRKALSSSELGTKGIEGSINFICSISGNVYIYESEQNYSKLNHTDIISYSINKNWPDGAAMIIRLSEDAYNEAAKIIEKTEGQKVYLSVGRDLSKNDLFYDQYLFGPISVYNNDEKTLICVDKDLQNGNLYNTMITTVMQEELPFLFGYELAHKIVWEKVKSSELDNQKNQIDEITINIIYDAKPSKEESDFNWDNTNRILKARIESMDVDFKYGYTGLDNKSIAVQLPIKNMGNDMFRLIGGYSQAKIENISGSFCEYVSALSYIKSVNDDYIIEIELDRYSKENFDEYRAKAFGDEDVLFLLINDVKISSSKLSDVNYNDTIMFRNLYFDGQSRISKEYEFLLKLLKHIVDNEIRKDIDMPYMLSYKKYSINKPKDDSYDYELGIKCETAYDKYIKANLHKYPVIKSIDRPIGINDWIDIDLSLPDNNDIYNAFSSAVEEIFIGLKLDESTYSCIDFSFFLPNKSLLSITFRPIRDSRGYHMSFVCTRGKFSIDTFKEHLLKNEFFVERGLDEASSVAWQN